MVCFFYTPIPGFAGTSPACGGGVREADGGGQL